MTTTASPLYGTATDLTITLASLASDTNLIAGRQSTAISNVTDDAILVDLFVKVTTGTTPTAARQIEIWLAGSIDNTLFAAGAGATDANFSPTGQKDNMILLKAMGTDGTSDHTYQVAFYDIPVFPGWAVFIVHNTGVALNATAGNHKVTYRTRKFESA
jgi:hypothetical protein